MLSPAMKILLATSAEAADGFPVVESQTGEAHAASTSWSVDMPSTVSSGDLLLMGVNAPPGDTDFTTPSGWTFFMEASTTASGNYLFYKVADGTEGGTTVSISVSASKPGSSLVYRVSDWFGSLAGVERANTQTSNNAPNPPSLSPSWGSAKTLWIAFVMAGDDNATLNSYPTGYTGGITVLSNSGNNNSAQIYSAYKKAEAASEDPGAFSISQSEAHTSVTIAVRPA